MTHLTASKQRQLLLAAGTPGFLTTLSGQVFIEQMRHHVAPRLLKFARNAEKTYRLDFDEVVNVVLVGACMMPAAQREYIASARKPWAYLGSVAIAWVGAEWGHRGTSMEELPWFTPETDSHSPGTTEPKTEDEIRIKEICDLTSAILLPRTPAPLRADVSGLIEWLAWNPVQRLTYEAQDRADAALVFPGLSDDQIRAVMNMVVGGRPVRAATSLFAAVALDATFEPCQSPTVARALASYRRVMRESLLPSVIVREAVTV